LERYTPPNRHTVTIKVTHLLFHLPSFTGSHISSVFYLPKKIPVV
jgi:hypothetical protein